MIAVSSATPVPSPSRRIPGMLAGASVIWGMILLALAAAVPIVTVQEAPAVATQASTDPSAATVDNAPTVLHAVPRVTLVTHDGPTVLLIVAIPLLASLVVGLLLWLRAEAGSTAAGIAAWTLSAAVLTGAVVGFVTFLIGIAVIPNGILLIAACARTPSPTGRRQLFEVDSASRLRVVRPHPYPAAMATINVSQVNLEPWSAGDLELLRKTNTPAMTEHLGGPETEEQLVARHRRYLDPDANGTMFRIVLQDGEVVGSTGYWEHAWNGEPAYETGYGILPEFQGRGLAVAATAAVAEKARTDGRHRFLYAFPSIDHAASNAVCRKAGFTLVEESEFEYPKSHFIRSNVWRMDLAMTDAE